MKNTVFLRSQKGSSLLMTLVVLALALLGAATLARVTSNGTLLAGNFAAKDAARHASDVGVSEAFARLQGLADLEADSDGWYFATRQGTELPPNELWEAAQELQVGQLTVRYLVERLCEGSLPLADAASQCFSRQVPMEGSAKAGTEALMSPPVMQFRVNVRVTGLKGTHTLVQALVNL